MDDRYFQRRLRNYLLGGSLSLITTLLAFWLVMNGVFEGFVLKLAIMTLALTQTAIQLFAFMHMAEKQETEENWERFSLIFTALTMAIIVVGSIWVMMNLNYNMGMSPEQMEQYMLEQNKKGF